MRIVVILIFLFFLFSSCSFLSYEGKSQFPRPYPSIISLETVVLKGIGRFRVFDIDENGDNQPDVRSWYLLYSERDDSLRNTVRYERSLQPYMLERLKMGFAIYREIDVDLDGEPDSIFVHASGRLELRWARGLEKE